MRTKNKKLSIALWIIVILLAIGMFGNLSEDENTSDFDPDIEYAENEKKLGLESDEPQTTWKDKENKIGAYVMAKQFVRDRLKSPSSAEFKSVWGGFDYDTDVDYLGSQEYVIRSWVDSENSFGATIRTHFTAKLKQTSEDNWELLNLNL